MVFGCVCSGISAPTVAWGPLGWKCRFYAEIEKFPSAVLAHHYGDTLNYGDFTGIGQEAGPIDLLVGGTPCQSFSVAGKRGGLDDPRGVLAFEYLALAGRLRPRWLVFENVPGMLSSDKGRDFGAWLGALAQLGYGWAYRVLDAQYFGVAQRRRRLFVVGYFGDWRRAAAVLFEREGLSGNPAPSRETGKEVAPTISARTKGGGGLGTGFDCDGGLVRMALNTKGGCGRIDAESETFVTHALTRRYDNSEDGCGRGTPIVPTLRSGHKGGLTAPAVAFNLRGREGGAQPELSDVASLRAASGGSSRSYVAGSGVRRLTPRECERLQGFPDDYTLIPYRNKPACDGPRYKALGNSMAVPVVRWIGRRIQMVDSKTVDGGTHELD